MVAHIVVQYVCDDTPTPWESDVMLPLRCCQWGAIAPYVSTAGVVCIMGSRGAGRVNVEGSNAGESGHRRRDEACGLRNLGSDTSPLVSVSETIIPLSSVPPCCVDRFRPLLSRSQWLPYSPWGLPPTPLVSLAVFRRLISTITDRRWLRPNIPLVSSIFIRLLPGALPSQNPSWSPTKTAAF